MTTLSEMMNHLRNRFAVAGIEDPMAEARILVGGLLGLGRTDFITRSEVQIDLDDEARILDAAGRRTRGEPPYRILGHRCFRGLDLRLSKGTLEPRPDTEILVQAVLDAIGGRRDDALEILDLGTGTGAIGLALLAELPKARAVGVDLSEDALATAVDNAAAYGLSDRFSPRLSDWFDRVAGTYDVIVSNPPYIRSEVIASLDREVREHDPLLALDGGDDGLDAYRKIAAAAAHFLKADGIVAVETGFDQRQPVEDIFTAKGFSLAAAHRDYGGNDRAQLFRLL